MHVADSSHTKAEGLLDAVDIAGKSVNVGIDKTWYKSVPRGRDYRGCANIATELSLSNFRYVSVKDPHKSLFDEVVPSEDPNVFDDNFHLLAHVIVLKCVARVKILNVV
jgi:hypothetical protein